MSISMKVLIDTDCTYFSATPFEWDTATNLKIPCPTHPQGDATAEHGFLLRPYFDAFEASKEHVLTGKVICEACNAEAHFTMKKLDH